MLLTVATRGSAPPDLAERLPSDVTLSDDEESVDVLLAVGIGGVRSIAERPPTVPVLFVDADVGRHGVTSEELDAELEAFATELDRIRARTVSHPVAEVQVGGFDARAALDVSLVASEPARISEFTVADPDGELSSFRADGVVVSTPAGSAGYSHAAGGPILTSGAGLGVVPISPYTTRPSSWVVDPPVTVTVERDETPVSLIVDGDERKAVAVDQRVTVDVVRSVSVVRPIGGTDGARRLEKL